MILALMAESLERSPFLTFLIVLGKNLFSAFGSNTINS